MKIAILGGSFDPPHIGHLLVAGQVKRMLNIDQVWLLPTYAHPFQKQLTPAKDRLAMTKVLENDSIKASDFEITKKGVSYTIDTLKSLEKAYPDHSFYWISGSDQVKDFPKWKNYEEFIQNYKIIIYARNAQKQTIEAEIKTVLGLPDVPQTMFVLETKDLPTIDISSSLIRGKIKRGESIKGLVPKAVETYILEHKLYQ